MGDVNAWCTAVQAPAPTATSPAATASEVGSNSGASLTQRKLHSLSSISPQRGCRSPAAPPRAAPGSASAPPPQRRCSRRASRPTCVGQAGPLGLGQVLGHGPGERAVVANGDVRQPLRAALLGPLLPGVELPPRLAAAARHDDGADVVRLEDPERGVREQRGAVDELARRIAGPACPSRTAPWPRRTASVGTASASPPRSAARSPSTTASPTSTTSSSVTKLISMSSWVNSGCRSARKSSSR